MTKTFWRRQLPLALLAGGLAVTAAAWQTHPADARPAPTRTDTVPDRKSKVRDIDDVLTQLEQSKVEVEQSLRQMDLSHLQKEMNEALKQVDGARIRAEIDRAMKEVNLDKIRLDVDRELAKVDMKAMQADLASIDAQKINADVQKALQSVDMDKIRAQVDASLKGLDAERIRAQVDLSGLDKVKVQMEDLRPQIERSIADARRGLEKGEQEIRNYKSLIDALDRDGALNKKGSYTIAYSKGELNVNGKKLDASKYVLFLDGRKDFTIKKDTESFSIEGSDMHVNGDDHDDEVN